MTNNILPKLLVYNKYFAKMFIFFRNEKGDEKLHEIVIFDIRRPF